MWDDEDDDDIRAFRDGSKKRGKKETQVVLHLQPVDVCYVHVWRGFQLGVGRLVIVLDPQDTHIHKYIESVSLFSQL